MNLHLLLYVLIQFDLFCKQPIISNLDVFCQKIGQFNTISTHPNPEMGSLKALNAQGKTISQNTDSQPLQCFNFTTHRLLMVYDTVWTAAEQPHDLTHKILNFWPTTRDQEINELVSTCITIESHFRLRRRRRRPWRRLFVGGAVDVGRRCVARRRRTRCRSRYHGIGYGGGVGRGRCRRCRYRRRRRCRSESARGGVAAATATFYGTVRAYKKKTSCTVHFRE